MADEPPRNLNTYRIEAALAKAFPGVELDIGHSLSTQVWRGTVWQFRIEVSLQAKRISFVDPKPGTGHIAVWQRDNNKDIKHPVRSHQLQTEQDLQKQLVWLRGYLLGISEAINRALKEPPPEPLADIFKDTP